MTGLPAARVFAWSRAAVRASRRCQVKRTRRDSTVTAFASTIQSANRDCERVANTMTITKPLLLLDVDGVLCPIGPGPGDRMRTLVVDEYCVIFSEKLPARLSSLSERFALVWATSWEHAANQHLAPALGLSELPVISFAGLSARPGRTWKLRAVRRFIGEHPIAWVDDDLGRDAHAWAEKRPQLTLLIDINPSWGLAEAHVDILVEFADRLA
jgi:HAD domain in Swiss Army Knife RNA repair proteins